MAKKQPDAGMKTKTWFQSLVMETTFPLLLIILTPLFLLTYVHFAVECRSNLKEITGQGVLQYLRRVLTEANFTDKGSWLVVLAFAAWSVVVPLWVGGKPFYGPTTLSGYRPRYVDCGFRFFLITTAVLGGALLWRPVGWALYLKLYHLTCATVLLGFVFCALLLVKGMICPSPGDHGSTGNLVFDFYWGRELYPKIGSLWYLKEWAVVFYGMAGWYAVVLICWKAQYEQIGLNWAMATSCVTLTIYMGKFYWWYSGYLHTLDMIYDRAGFYLGWGGVGLMPSFMACHAVYMVENPSDWGPGPCLAAVVLGVLTTVLTYWSDIQRLEVRASDGRCTVWGRPARVVRATYKDLRGRDQTSLLLASGFWGVVRHPNYVLEMAANVAWTIPAGLDSVVPHLWIAMLLAIILQRIGRDDNKCRKKYGRFWEEYCRQVPYMLIPGLL